MSTHLSASAWQPQTAVELYGWNGMVSAALMVPAHFASTGKVVDELKFVFWQSMFTSRHDTRLWNTRLASSLPGALAGSTEKALRERIYRDLETIRRVRNRVAHHEPIFTRDLQSDLNRMLELIELRSPETAVWVRQLEDVSALLLQRPVPH